MRCGNSRFHYPDYPSDVLKSGRGLDDSKRVTITTLQTMINEYEDFSSSYFDLVFTDECHRSIYGNWSGVLKVNHGKPHRSNHLFNPLSHQRTSRAFHLLATGFRAHNRTDGIQVMSQTSGCAQNHSVQCPHGATPVKGYA
jgi:hypothetical protein